MIDVIGLGVTDQAQLSKAAQFAIANAALVIGSERQLQVIAALLADEPTDNAAMLQRPQQVCLPPLSELLLLLTAQQGEKIVILASGDPLHYGIGRWLTKHIGKQRLTFHPAVSSMQAACHLLGFSLQDVEVLSLHGRPLEKIRSVLKANKPLLVLTDKHSQPIHLAQACCLAGFAESAITVLENLGYPQQQVRRFSVAQLIADSNGDNSGDNSGDNLGDNSADNSAALSFAPLHLTFIEPRGAGMVLPEFPGFADQLFITGSAAGSGMITKREVRLTILSLLQPSHNDVIWDIGAGCGSVAIELAYWQKNADIYAIEHHCQRLSCLAENRIKFGVVDNLKVINGKAPAQLSSLPVANKVFIGGSGGALSSILACVWQQLPQHGVLVASAVTENSKFLLQKFAEQLTTQQSKSHIETLQIAIAKGTTLAGQLMYKPNLPVTLYKFIKHD